MRSFAVNIHATTSPAVSTAEWQARVDLAAVYRLVAHYGWDDVIYNHAEAADSPGHGPTFSRYFHCKKPASPLTLLPLVAKCLGHTATKADKPV
jgi:hypothetical protein